MSFVSRVMSDGKGQWDPINVTHWSQTCCKQGGWSFPVSL